MKYEFPEGKLSVDGPWGGLIHVDDPNWPGLPAWNVSWWVPILGSKLGTVWAWTVKAETEKKAVTIAKQLLKVAREQNKFLDTQIKGQKDEATL